MNERGCFGVEAMQTIGLFVNKSVVLRHELPSNLGRVNSRGSVGHDEAMESQFVAFYS